MLTGIRSTLHCISLSHDFVLCDCTARDSTGTRSLRGPCVTVHISCYIDYVCPSERDDLFESSFFFVCVCELRPVENGFFLASSSFSFIYIYIYMDT